QTRASFSWQADVPRHLVDVEESVCGGVREPYRRRGCGERAERNPRDVQGEWLRRGGGSRLVPPGRGGPTDAGGMARADGPSPCPLVQQSASRRVRNRDGLESDVRSGRGMIRRTRSRRSSQPTKKEWIRRSRSGAEALSTLPRPPLTDGSLGGDPSAGSPTDTLLRLSPPC